MSSAWNVEKPHYVFIIKWERVRRNIVYVQFILQEIATKGSIHAYPSTLLSSHPIPHKK
jgi:hypothetical protein